MEEVLLLLYVLAFVVGVVISLLYSAIFFAVAKIKSDFLTKLSLSVSVSISFIIASLVAAAESYDPDNKLFLLAVLVFFILTLSASSYVFSMESETEHQYKKSFWFSLILSIGTGIVSYLLT
jgi:hypothetical protein